MQVAAFDSKPFNRGAVAEARGAQDGEQYAAHTTQLGIGVVVRDADAFRNAFVAEFGRLKGEFGIETDLPFMPTNGLLKHGRRKATAFADKLVSSVQGMIEGVHCSFVVLSPKKHPTVTVGGGGDPTRTVETRPFIDSLGPMFSYMTAQSYVHAAKKIPTGLDIRIDSFVSKQTRAWDILEKLKPRVYWRGDECDAAIACADMLAFLTDAKLYSAYLKLEPDNVRMVWEPYSFDIDVSVYGRSNLWSYAWYSKNPINIYPYLAKPTVFLAIDDLADPAPGGAGADPDAACDAAAGAPCRSEPRPIPFRRAMKQSDTYVAAVRRAFDMSGSLKIFKLDEDIHSVRDGDVFVYIGDRSKRVGESLRHAAEIEVVSGLDLRRSIKSNKLVTFGRSVMPPGEATPPPSPVDPCPI